MLEAFIYITPKKKKTLFLTGLKNLHTYWLQTTQPLEKLQTRKNCKLENIFYWQSTYVIFGPVTDDISLLPYTEKAQTVERTVSHAV